MLSPKVCHISRTGGPTKFELDRQIEHEDPYQGQAPWPPRSKVKVTRQINARVADAMWLIWNRSTDVTAVGSTLCRRHSLLFLSLTTAFHSLWRLNGNAVTQQFPGFKFWLDNLCHNVSMCHSHNAITYDRWWHLKKVPAPKRKIFYNLRNRSRKCTIVAKRTATRTSNLLNMLISRNNDEL